MIKVAYTFKAGQTYRYHLSSASSSSLTIGPRLADAPKGTVSADVTWKVASVDTSGNATIDLTLSVKDSFPPTEHYRFQVTPTGVIVSPFPPSIGSLLASSGWAGPPGTDQFLAILPGHAIKPGDTWTKTFTVPAPYGQGNITYTTESRFLRFENLPGGRAAVIQTKATIPRDVSVDPQTYHPPDPRVSPTPAPISGTVRIQSFETYSTTTWFDVQTGQVARMITVRAGDQTTTFSGYTGQVPLGDCPLGAFLDDPCGPVHIVASQTIRLDRLPTRS